MKRLHIALPKEQTNLTATGDIYEEQGHYETGTWLRMLDYQQQENVHMKNRIADIVKRNVGKETLEKLEHYQSLFINKDAVIVLLRRDIVQLSHNGERSETVISQLRKDVQRMEKEFSSLRVEFNDYIRSIFNS